MNLMFGLNCEPCQPFLVPFLLVYYHQLIDRFIHNTVHTDSNKVCLLDQQGVPVVLEIKYPYTKNLLWQTIPFSYSLRLP